MVWEVSTKTNNIYYNKFWILPYNDLMRKIRHKLGKDVKGMNIESTGHK